MTSKCKDLDLGKRLSDSSGCDFHLYSSHYTFRFSSYETHTALHEVRVHACLMNPLKLPFSHVFCSKHEMGIREELEVILLPQN